MQSAIMGFMLVLIFAWRRYAIAKAKGEEYDPYGILALKRQLISKDTPHRLKDFVSAWKQILSKNKTDSKVLSEQEGNRFIACQDVQNVQSEPAATTANNSEATPIDILS